MADKMILETAGQSMYMVFGSWGIVALVIIAYVITLALAAGAGKTTIVVIIMPLIAALTWTALINQQYHWITIGIFILMAISFTSVILYLTR